MPGRERRKIERRAPSGTGGPAGGGAGANDNGGAALRGGGGFFIGGGNPAFEDCLPERFQQFQAQFTVPRAVINQVVNPPSTDITNTAYSAAGVDPSQPNVGLITSDQITQGRWFGRGATNEVILNAAYANTKKLGVGSTIPIDGVNYKVVGLAKPTLTGSTADVYFPLATLQKLASKPNRVTQILVKAKSAGDVDAVAASIKKSLPGATIITTKSLADQVTGSLANAHKLASRLGGALAVIVLLAAFVIAALLTLSSISKRVREIGTLRAVGWSKGRVVRQILGETLGIAFLGGLVGLLVGVGVAGAVHWLSPTLDATTTGVPGVASSASAAFLGIAQSSSQTTQKVTLGAPLHPSTLVLGVVFALIGGLVAGLAASWRAARLAPATTLRDLG
jgi:putative ABC transport system permease protein